MENFFRLSWTTKVSSRVCGIITKQVLSAHPTTSNHGISSPTFHLCEHDRRATPQSSSVAITSSWSPSVIKIKEVPTTHPTVSELSGNHSCSHLRGGQKGRHAMPRYLLLPPSLSQHSARCRVCTGPEMAKDASFVYFSTVEVLGMTQTRPSKAHGTARMNAPHPQSRFQLPNPSLRLQSLADAKVLKSEALETLPKTDSRAHDMQTRPNPTFTIRN